MSKYSEVLGTKARGTSKLIDYVPGLLDKVRDITFLSQTQHNNSMMIMNGDLYTTSGDNSSNANSGTGRGLRGQISVHGTHQGYSKVEFVDLPSGVELVKVGGTGYMLNYALFDNGYCYTWGSNISGVCGLGHTAAVAVPTLMATDVVEAYDSTNGSGYSIAEYTFLTKRSDGFIYGSGTGNDGQFGLGNTLYQNTQVKLDWIGQNPMFVASQNGMGGRLLIQKADGTIWSSGNGEGGSMFTGAGSHTSLPIDVTNNVGGINGGTVEYHQTSYRYYTTAGVGSSSSILMRRKADGTTSIYTVGYNGWGQRGDGTTTASVTPYLVPNMSDIKEIDGIGGNVRTVRVLKNNGDMYTWGNNGQGQASVGSTSNVLLPTLVTTGVDKLLLKNVASHTYGYNVQNFILKLDGSVWCAGDNVNYYLGLGSTANPTSLTKHTFFNNNDKVKFIGGFVTASAGRTLVAVTESNKVYTWGYNSQYGVIQTSAAHIRRPILCHMP